MLTGPNSYGTLRASNVIHAVGPHYMQYTAEEGDALLTSAYTNSLERAREAGLEAVAFSLLSAGVFRGSRSLREVLRVGVAAMSQFRGYAGLEEVHLCAFNEREANTLVDIANEMGLENGGAAESTSACDLI